MSRRTLIAGNWKMNTTLDDARDLAWAVAEATEDVEVDVVVIPPACFLVPVAEALAGSHVTIGAQNLHAEDKGAFTGEVSGPMLASAGCAWVLCGHSERRHIFGETNELVGDKVAAAHRAGLTPILCVGETLDQRDDGVTEVVVKAQVETGLAKIDAGAVERTVIAYEPVWAIGTGRTATPEQAQAVHAFIRGLLRETYGDGVADAVRIQYGGSVKPDNATQLMSQEDVDGALVGGASLKAEDFAALVRA